jgi:hypothetical protein
VRCQVDDDQWRVTARTKDTWIEDSEAPDGAVPVYAVSAVAGGARSAEVRSAS